MVEFRWRPGAVDDLSDTAAEVFEADGLPLVVQAVKASTPDQSGRARDNIVADGRTGAGTSTVWTIRSRAISDDGYNYPLAVIYGRREVRPVRAKALRWIDPRTRQVVFAKRSRATKGNNYMAKGFRTAGLIRVREL